MLDDTKQRLLDAAQLLIQTQGFNGFSYRDLAGSVGIRTASIHYHYPAKADLGVALVERYRGMISGALGEIAARPVGLEKQLELTARMYVETLHNGGRICVCAALAGEYHALPEAMREALRRLIDDSEGGITRLLQAGRERGELPATADPRALARLWYSTLQGALVVARVAGEPTLRQVIATLRALTFTKPPG